jgi:hypothetical protein
MEAGVATVKMVAASEKALKIDIDNNDSQRNYGVW